MSKIKVIQLEDKKGTPITPYTSASSVYLPDGTNVETQIGGMDINAIEAQQAEAMQQIGDATTIAIARIGQEQAQDRAAIARLSCEVSNMDVNLLPLEIVYSITPNEAVTSCDIHFVVNEYKGSIPTLNSMIVSKSSNGGPSKIIFNGTSYTGDVTCAIEGGKEVFTFAAKTDNKSTTVIVPRYLVFYATSTEGEIADIDICGFDKKLVDESGFELDIDSHDGEYVWLLIPTAMNINEITHQSIAFTTNDPVMVEVDTFGFFRAYRSVKALADATWNLKIK